MPEASFSIYGERGWIDLLAWHASTRTLLVIEIKTAIVDVQELTGILDRKVRLAPEVAKQRGWRPLTVSSWLIVTEGSTNRRHVGKHAALFAAALPDDARRIRRWLRRPVGVVRALSFLPADDDTISKRPVVTTKRVCTPIPAVARA